MDLHMGMLVYAPDKEQLWMKAYIKEKLDNSRCTVTFHHNQESGECKIADLLPCSEQAVLKINNLTELSPINKASVIFCLDERYKADILYTSAGSTIVAVNPFRDVSHLYSHDMVFGYHSEQQTDPHIYQIGCQAYKRMIQELGKGNQTVIVSGESGSGKTVSAKHLLRYMTTISNSSRDESSDRHSPQGQCVERRLLDSNPILEAFGNAVTQRNNNSSRFGKFIKLQFSRNGQMFGGQIQTYLLEKTRVVYQSPGECNFHIFYQLLKSIRESPDTSLCQLFDEIGEEDMKGIPEEKCIENNRDLNETLEAMTEIGLTQETQDNIMKILVSILFLCNMEFIAVDDEMCKLVANKDHHFLDTTFTELEVTQLSLEQTADLLGIQPSHIEQALLSRSITSGGNTRRSIFIKPVPQREAYSRKDCLATLLYSRLFEWLVQFINSQIEADNFTSTIGLLDIYGFEAFENNSLEQLCINYANEKLQQHYVQHFMRDLQREYLEECIDWQSLDYTDNKPCLDVLEGQPSVLGLLNEEVQLNRKTDTQQLCERILQLTTHAKQYIIRPKTFMKCPAFTIRHYAGHVTYRGEGLAMKNKDNIPQELIDLLQNSTNPFLVELFEKYTVDSSNERKRKTVLGKFKSSLDQLLHSLHTSDVHYIRCIKPNTSFQPGQFDRHYVMEQLEAGGIVETIKISCHGYPVRMPYGDFLQRYSLILRNPKTPNNSAHVETKDTDTLYDPLDLLYKKQLEMVSDSPRRSTTPRKRLRRRAGLSSCDHARRSCAAVLKEQFDNCEGLTKQFGKSKLFMYQHQVDNLEKRRLEILHKKASLIQKVWRRFAYKRKRQRQKKAVITIQKAWRSYVRCKQTKAALVLQKTFRMHSAKKLVKRMKDRTTEHTKTRKRSWQTIIDRSSTSRSSSRRSTRSSGQRSSGSEGDMSNSWSSSASELSQNNSHSNTSLELFVPSSKFTTSTPRCLDDRKGSDELHNKEAEFKRPRTVQKMIKGRPNFVSENFKKSSATRSSNGIPFEAIENRSCLEIPEVKYGSDSGIPEVKYGSDSGIPPVKKQKTDDGYRTTQCDVSLGDGIITRRRLPKVPIKFHTRPSVLKNAHFVHQRELTCGLQDCLPDNQSKHSEDQSTGLPVINAENQST